jgi:branched-chain amino acid transport system ATP-binding protein
VRFGGLTALDDVSFDVERGSIVSLIGPNGSGKSTALNCISGVHPPSAGTIRLDGETISGLAPHRIAARGVARTFQTPELAGDTSVLENVMLGRHRHMTTGVRLGMLMSGRRSRAAREEAASRERVAEILAALDLSAVRDRAVRDLPLAVRKRVELARALAAEPALLLVDEPSAGMDAPARSRVGELLARLRDDTGVTIVLIEHHLELAIGLADRVLALGFGRRIAEGTPEEVIRHPAVVEAYHGDG